MFNGTCASCHRQNGVPTAVGKSLNAPELGSSAVQKQTTAQLQQIIGEGKGNMPPFKGSLSEAQINSLITYVCTFSRKDQVKSSVRARWSQRWLYGIGKEWPCRTEFIGRCFSYFSGARWLSYASGIVLTIEPGDSFWVYALRVLLDHPLSPNN